MILVNYSRSPTCPKGVRSVHCRAVFTAGDATYDTHMDETYVVPPDRTDEFVRAYRGTLFGALRIVAREMRALGRALMESLPTR